ncbi:hypothetical protein XCR_4408 [Xanthomonas campestris pv. raphani 756C]|nr:hypothetical protein XCR_4408 [Xanthomonas campestris pv. raphani 756C]
MRLLPEMNWIVGVVVPKLDIFKKVCPSCAGSSAIRPSGRNDNIRSSCAAAAPAMNNKLSANHRE